MLCKGEQPEHLCMHAASLGELSYFICGRFCKGMWALCLRLMTDLPVEVKEAGCHVSRLCLGVFMSAPLVCCRSSIPQCNKSLQSYQSSLSEFPETELRSVRPRGLECCSAATCLDQAKPLLAYCSLQTAINTATSACLCHTS